MYSMSAVRLASYIASLPDMNYQTDEERTGYGHMGATLTDAVLQAGLNYHTVVYPRVQEVLTQFPEATTTSSFSNVLDLCTPAKVLRWSHPEKPRRVRELTNLLLNAGVETEGDLQTWINLPCHEGDLLSLRGVGPKTVDYIKLLVGLPTVAIDRHIRTFATMAGLQIKDYDELKKVVLESAKILDLNPGTLDHSIWWYLSRSGDNLHD